MLRSLSLLVLLACVPISGAADEPVSLGTVRIHAWLGKPAMPPIHLSRGPIQQVMERLEPPALRLASLAWEEDVARHRQLRRARDLSARSLRQHYEHELLLHPEEGAALRAQRSADLERLNRRFDEDAAAREQRMRAEENELLRGLTVATRAGKVAVAAAAQLVRAEIQFARHQDMFDRLVRKWEREQALHEASGGGETPRPPTPFLRPVAEALDRVRTMAPDRLTRERALQMLSLVHLEEGRAQKSERLLESMLQRGVSWSMEPELRNRLGDLLLTRGRFAGAARHYGAVGKKAGGWFLRARLGLAWSRHRLGSDRRALQALTAVLRQTEGMVEGAMLQLRRSAEALQAQLLAESGRALPRRASARLRSAVAALRTRTAEFLPGTRDSADGRLSRLGHMVGPLRQCYRDWLARNEAIERGHQLVLRLTSAAPPSLVRSGVPDASFKRCVRKTVSRVERLPDDADAFVTLTFRPSF